MQPRFEETQPWRSNPILSMVLVVVLVTLAGFAVLLFLDESATPTWEWLLLAVIAGILLAILLGSRLRVRVWPDHLEVHMVGLRRRRIPWRTIQSVQAVQYRPLAHYGGWGIRYGGRQHGWAYNVRGNQGVRIELQDNAPLLVGSQRPQQLLSAIQAAMATQKTDDW